MCNRLKVGIRTRSFFMALLPKGRGRTLLKGCGMSKEFGRMISKSFRACWLTFMKSCLLPLILIIWTGF